MTAKLIDDPLMLSEEWEGKRCQRFAGPSQQYAERLDRFRDLFPMTFSALENKSVDEVRDAFKTEVLK